ncbi:hypothetical protein ANANG_G00138980 [Anguilla anguilla]|uniref:Uncharacterized protein n=1 Tax=Anguilla anguilla TaxID=7936 RepID=A0A9D3RVS7_ANGAN|nr:hypothetical protein ANANG_G00138980 [Anguilla anguilla]
MGRRRERVACRRHRSDRTSHGQRLQGQGIWCIRRREGDRGLSPGELRWRRDGMVIPYSPRQPGRNGQRGKTQSSQGLCRRSLLLPGRTGG